MVTGAHGALGQPVMLLVEEVLSREQESVTVQHLNMVVVVV